MPFITQFFDLFPPLSSVHTNSDEVWVFFDEANEPTWFDPKEK